MSDAKKANLSVRVTPATAKRCAEVADGKPSRGARTLMEIGLNVTDERWHEALFMALCAADVIQMDPGSDQVARFKEVLADQITRKPKSATAKVLSDHWGQSDEHRAFLGTLLASVEEDMPTVDQFLYDPDAYPRAVKLLEVCQQAANSPALMAEIEDLPDVE